MPNPRLSVAMPVFNAQRYVEEAAESILGQTFGDFELIVIDDGSSDGSRDVLRRLARRDRRIHLVEQENAGEAAARNRALALARAELVALHDADDVSLPDRFARQVEYLRDHEDCLVLGTQTLLIDPDGSPVVSTRLPLDDATMRQWLLGGLNPISHPTVMARTSAIRAAGYRDGFPPAADYDLWLRLSEEGQLANLPQVLLHYRLHEASMSSRQADLQARNARRALEEACRRRGLPPPPPAPRPRRALWRLPPRARWARLGYTAGNFAAGLRLSGKAVRAHPFSPGAWQVLAEALVAPLAVPAVRVASRWWGGRRRRTREQG